MPLASPLHRSRALALSALITCVLAACGHRPVPPTVAPYDPLGRAIASVGHVSNLEAGVPPQCYTRTAGVANPCWTCHTTARGSNQRTDWQLQERYAFSDVARHNHWTNLFHPPDDAATRALSDADVLRYIRADNYGPLREALRARADYPGYVPDLDLARGFDDAGFARDGSGWRALRYKPFAGAFWPTNGSTDDVMIRLPRAFRVDAAGAPSTTVYRANLAILEAAIAVDPRRASSALDRAVEPVDEATAGADLDGNGTVSGTVTRLRVLPAHYAGGARDVAVERYRYPAGTEFLHTVRYVDPDAPALLSVRLKELRYARKVEAPDNWATLRAYEREDEERQEGHLPRYAGSPLVGLRNTFGWQLQGFIEDEAGRLRLQTEEEHRYCMGCHTGLGVTVDQTFAFARKVPGAAGFRHQDLRGIPDAPQAGHAEPEVLEYLRRAQGGDEFRANTEMLARFLPGGVLDATQALHSPQGGAADLASLLAPSRARALALDRAYIALVRAQRFDLGRDAVLAPATNVHADITDEGTGLAATGRIYRDGVLWLDWDAPSPSPAE